MSGLVNDFKKEHEAILFNFREVKRLGVHTMEGRDKLMSARRELLEHLNKEDEYFYPGLKEAGQSDPELKEILKGLDREMKEITDYCTGFYEKYELNGGGIEFFRDFDKFQKVLENRIKKEEDLLYKMYDEATGRTG